MSASIREQIKDIIDWSEETVPVPEWNTTILMRSMSAADRYEVLKVGGDPAKFHGRMIVECAHSTTGERLFQLGDEEWLMQKRPDVLDRLGDAALRICGLDSEAGNRGKDSSSTTPSTAG